MDSALPPFRPSSVASAAFPFGRSQSCWNDESRVAKHSSLLDGLGEILTDFPYRAHGGTDPLASTPAVSPEGTLRSGPGVENPGAARCPRLGFPADGRGVA